MAISSSLIRFRVSGVICAVVLSSLLQSDRLMGAAVSMHVHIFNNTIRFSGTDTGTPADSGFSPIIRWTNSSAIASGAQDQVDGASFEATITPGSGHAGGGGSRFEIQGQNNYFGLELYTNTAANQSITGTGTLASYAGLDLGLHQAIESLALNDGVLSLQSGSGFSSIQVSVDNQLPDPGDFLTMKVNSTTETFSFSGQVSGTPADSGFSPIIRWTNSSTIASGAQDQVDGAGFEAGITLNSGHAGGGGSRFEIQGQNNYFGLELYTNTSLTELVTGSGTEVSYASLDSGLKTALADLAGNNGVLSLQSGTGFNDIRLTLVPEPGSCTVATVLGLSAFCVLRQRRRTQSAIS